MRVLWIGFLVVMALFVMIMMVGAIRTGTARNDYCIEAGGVPVTPKTCIRPEALIPVQP